MDLWSCLPCWNMVLIKITELKFQVTSVLFACSYLLTLAAIRGGARLLFTWPVHFLPTVMLTGLPVDIHAWLPQDGSPRTRSGASSR